MASSSKVKTKIRSASSSSSRSHYPNSIILVADDDSTSLALTSAILRQLKYKVVTVDEPDKVLSAIKAKKEIKLVVTDLRMLHMSGTELQKIIKEEFNLPIVIMSANDKEKISIDILASGVVSYVRKPAGENDFKNVQQYVVTMKKDEKSSNKDVRSSSRRSSDEDVNSMNKKRESIEKKDNVIYGSEDGEEDLVGEDRVQKKPRLKWTTELEHKFLEAVDALTLEKAVPKDILEYMKVPGLTRANVASRWQKYKLALRQKDGIKNEPPKTRTRQEVRSAFAASYNLYLSRMNAQQNHRTYSSELQAMLSSRNRLTASSIVGFDKNVSSSSFSDKSKFCSGQSYLINNDEASLLQPRSSWATNLVYSHQAKKPTFRIEASNGINDSNSLGGRNGRNVMQTYRKPENDKAMTIFGSQSGTTRKSSMSLHPQLSQTRLNSGSSQVELQPCNFSLRRDASNFSTWETNSMNGNDNNIISEVFILNDDDGSSKVTMVDDKSLGLSHGRNCDFNMVSSSRDSFTFRSNQRNSSNPKFSSTLASATGEANTTSLRLPSQPKHVTLYDIGNGGQLMNNNSSSFGNNIACGNLQQLSQTDHVIQVTPDAVNVQFFNSSALENNIAHSNLQQLDHCNGLSKLRQNQANVQLYNSSPLENNVAHGNLQHLGRSKNLAQLKPDGANVQLFNSSSFENNIARGNLQQVAQCDDLTQFTQTGTNVQFYNSSPSRNSIAHGNLQQVGQVDDFTQLTPDETNVQFFNSTPFVNNIAHGGLQVLDPDDLTGLTPNGDEIQFFEQAQDGDVVTNPSFAGSNSSSDLVALEGIEEQLDQFIDWDDLFIPGDCFQSSPPNSNQAAIDEEREMSEFIESLIQQDVDDSPGSTQVAARDDENMPELNVSIQQDKNDCSGSEGGNGWNEVWDVVKDDNHPIWQSTEGN